jgi:hypothetical protein
MDDKKFDLKLLDCPNAEVPNLGLKNYYDSFGDIFLQALELEIFRHHYMEIMNNLSENKLIKLRKERRSDNPKILTLFEFLIKNNFLLKKDADRIIRGISKLSNAKAMVGRD